MFVTGRTGRLKRILHTESSNLPFAIADRSFTQAQTYTHVSYYKYYVSSHLDKCNEKAHKKFSISPEVSQSPQLCSCVLVSPAIVDGCFRGSLTKIYPTDSTMLKQYLKPKMRHNEESDGAVGEQYIIDIGFFLSFQVCSCAFT